MPEGGFPPKVRMELDDPVETCASDTYAVEAATCAHGSDVDTLHRRRRVVKTMP